MKHDQLAGKSQVFVYEWPIRLWHWINALSILALMLTGYFIGSPLPSLGGEAYNTFFFGYIRFAHFAAAYVLTLGFLARIYWAIVGNEHSRQLFTFPFWDGEFWKEVFIELRWYFFLAREPKKYIGHNPLAHVAMFLMVTVTTLFMIATGFAMYAEGAGQGTWQHKMFGWVINIFVNTQNLHTWHHLGMWVLVVFVIVHVYAAIREDNMSRQSIISTMISGIRQFKDTRP